MSRLVKIKYIQDIELPRGRSGKAGEVKEVQISVARDLVRNGFAEYVAKEEKLSASAKRGIEARKLTARVTESITDTIEAVRSGQYGHSPKISNVDTTPAHEYRAAMYKTNEVRSKTLAKEAVGDDKRD